MGLSNEQMKELTDVERAPEVLMCMHGVMTAIPIMQTPFDPPIFKVRVMGHMITPEDSINNNEFVEDHRLIVVEMCMDELRLSSMVSDIASAHHAHLRGDGMEGTEGN